MVAGTSWPHGDPFLQRQNEPSVAVSTRNPLHLLAGANDYRSVDIPFDTPASPDNEERGDAWVGVFKSRNGGATWWSDLLPGYPQDPTPAGLASPVHGFQAAADPVVRAGANGMFYFSGIVLNRDTNPLGAVFVSRFIDNNNTENGDPIAYVGTNVIDKGTAGAFIDKPWIAVAPGTGQCTVNGQTFPAQNVYLAYTVFVGNDNNIRTKLMFTRSTDCGATWASPTKLSESYAVNQGASIAVAPNGTVYVVWRRFKTVTDTNAIMIAKSSDKGQTFTKGAVVRDINPFEQGMTYYSIRTNAYPSAAADDGNTLYVAWADRSFEPNGDGRIVMMRSPDGATWSGPTVVDGGPWRGSQFMPAITAVGGKVVVAYYDLRDDDELRYYTPVPHSGGVYNEHEQPVGDLPAHPELVFTQYLMDVAHHRRHTLDLRAAEASTSVLPTAFTGFTRVSHYAFGSRPPQNPTTLCELGPGCIEQLQYNPPNLPMFRLGTAPFIGDYIDLTGYAAGNERVLHAVWTDNRDVRPPANGNWANYTPVHLGTAPSRFGTGNQPNCVAGQTGMRNQNIYTARITNGVFASSPGNSKQLLDKNGQPITRAFVVYVQNATSDKNGRTFELTVTQPMGGWASFDQFDQTKTTVDVLIPPRSSVARSVFVHSTFDHASVQVNIAEGSGGVLVPNGLTATVIINPDVSNPDVSNPDVSNPDVSNPDVSNPDVSNPDVSNVEVHNPDVSNPNVSNPDVSNPDVSNPDVSNPDVSNPDVSNPDVSNPDVSNPDVSNPDVSNTSVSDTTWTTHNKGNTTSGYNIKLATTTPIPNGVRTQLIINRIYQTPVARDCVLGVDNHRQIIANILDPTIGTIGQIATVEPAATLWLAPGDAARITLRVYNPTPLTTPFNPSTAVAPVVVAEAVNSDDAKNGITTPPFAIPLVINTTAVNDAVAGQSYSTPMAATGGKGSYTWSVTGPGAFSVQNGMLTGTFANAGDAILTVNVSDSANPPHTSQKAFTVHVFPPLTITTASLPTATQGFAYNTSFASTGGAAPIHWSAVTSMPDGMTLSPDGTISGISPFTETPVIQVRATDSSNPPQIVLSQQLPLVVQSAICTGSAFQLFDNSNVNAVSNGGTSPAFSTNGQTYCLDSIVTYHWNNSQGATPGSIGLLFNNQSVGSWKATGSSGQGGATNVNWTAVPAPQVIVMNGTYSVIDSDPSTWSQNSGSNGFGFTHVWVKTAVKPGTTFTVTGHLKFNGVARTPSTTPQFFLRNEGSGQQQQGATIVWNNNDTFTISGLPSGTFGVEVASKESATAVFYPGSFYSFTDFDAAAASTNGFDVTLNRVIHTTVPADNATTFAAYACPPALSVSAPTQFAWDAIDVPATYSWQITKYSCSSGTPTPIASGAVSGTSLTLPSALPATGTGEYYTFTITAMSTGSPSVPVGEIMTNGTDWHGWDLRFTVPPSTVAQLPGVAAGFGQLEVFDVSGLFTTDGASVHFVDQNGKGLDGFTFLSPSTPSRLYVRLPIGTGANGLADGPLTATVNLNGSPIASTTITQSTTPGTPIIQAIRNMTTGDCSGTLDPNPTTTINAGRGIAVSAFGTDTTGAEVQFTMNGVPTVVGSSCAEDGASIGEAAIVGVPANLSGSVDVAIRTTVNGVPSAWSKPVTVTVTPQVP